MHVAVIGAGITGLVTAWTLIEAGHTVTLVEAARVVATGASAQNGAQLSYSFVAPLASPSTLVQLPGLLLDTDSPLRFRPSMSIEAWRWCVEFALACRTAQSNRTTLALLSLASLSRERFAAWRATVPCDSIDYAQNGKLVVYRSESALDAARRQLSFQAPHGPPQQLCDAAECLAVEPSLVGAKGAFSGGVLTPSEEVADCAKVCQVIAQALSTSPHFQARWNATAVAWRLRDNRVNGLQCERDGTIDSLQADAYVVANGVMAPNLLRQLGTRVAITPLKGYSIEVPARALRRLPSVSVTDVSAKTVFAPLGCGDTKRLRVAGVAELVGFDASIDARRVAQLKSSTAALFGLDDPSIEVHPWAGFRPSTPTSLPSIGRLRKHANVYVNAGQGALGFTLAFGSAALLLAEMQGELPPIAVTSSFKAGLHAA